MNKSKCGPTNFGGSDGEFADFLYPESSGVAARCGCLGTSAIINGRWHVIGNPHYLLRSCSLLIGRKHMDWNQVEGNWKEVQCKVKQKWAKLTDDDLTAINGQRQELEGRLQKRYGYAKDQARKDVDDWFSTLP